MAATVGLDGCGAHPLNAGGGGSLFHVSSGDMAYWLLCFLSLVCLTTAQAQQPPEPRALHFEQAMAVDGATPSPPEDPAGTWITLPDVWQGAPDALPQQRWYHFEFEDGGWKLPAVYIERACTNVEIWINGERLGSGGSMVEPLTRTCYFSHLFSMHRTSLKPTGNRLDLRVVGYPREMVASRQRAGGLAPVWVGSQAELAQRQSSRNFWNIDLGRVIGISVGLFGVFMVTLGGLRRQNRHPLFFGIALILWSLMGTRLYVQDAFVSWRAMEILYTALYAPFAYALVQTLMHYVRQPRRRVHLVMAWQCALVPLVLIMIPSHWMADVAVALYGLLSFEFMAALGFFGWHSWRIMRQDFWVLGGVLLVLLLLTVLEVAIQAEWLGLPSVHLLHLAMPLIALIMGGRLVQEFAAAMEATDQLNRDLEQRVADKSAEIERTYQQLSAMRVEQAAQAERHRIASDLHDDLGAQLVTIAQASLVANDIPRVSELARKALADMRLAVRGLTSEPQPVAHVLADWRSETVERLHVAGIAVTWNASEAAPDEVLPSRIQVQLTRVLREAVSNVIHHSHAQNCWVDVHVTAQELTLGVEDDGHSFDMQRVSTGRGLRNLESRTLAMAGTLTLGHRQGGGTSVRVKVPLGGAKTQPLPPDERSSP